MYSEDGDFHIKKIDDFNFLSPIYMGCALKFEASVVFAAQGILTTAVVAWVITPNKEVYKALIVHLTFEMGKGPGKAVYPKTYAETLGYFEAKRKLKKVLKET